jgi:hypothetical protein
MAPESGRSGIISYREKQVWNNRQYREAGLE